MNLILRVLLAVSTVLLSLSIAGYAASRTLYLNTIDLNTMVWAFIASAVGLGLLCALTEKLLRNHVLVRIPLYISYAAFALMSFAIFPQPLTQKSEQKLLAHPSESPQQGAAQPPSPPSSRPSESASTPTEQTSAPASREPAQDRSKELWGK